MAVFVAGLPAHGKPVTELNLLVREENGKIRRCQLLGTLTKKEMERTSIILSREIGIELHVLTENRKGQIVKREVFKNDEKFA